MLSAGSATKNLLQTSWSGSFTSLRMTTRLDQSFPKGLTRSP